MKLDRPLPRRQRLYFARNVDGESRREPLFYLHGDFDGGGFYCLSLASCLGPDQPLYALNPHGMDGQPLPRSIEAMAAAHVDTMVRLMPRASYRLGGHCNGGLIAFEMARQLVARDARVDRLVLVAARADYWQVKPLPRSGTHYARRLRWWWSLDPSQKRRELVRLAWKLTGSSAAKVATPPPRQSELFQAYRRVMAAYRPGPYAGAVTLLWPSDEPNLRPEDPTMGWSRVARMVEVHTVPGDHLSCLRAHVQPLAATMRRSLEETTITA